MDLKKTGYLLLGLLLIFSLGLNFWVIQNQDRIAYVDLQKVFNEFQGTKEMESIFASSENSRRHILDSISLDLQQLQKRINMNPKVEELAKEIYQKKSLLTKLNADFIEKNQEEDQMFSSKIWTHINQYTKDYGDENGYDFIYGISGNGALMYGKTDKDITSNLIKYINNRYEGL